MLLGVCYHSWFIAFPSFRLAYFIEFPKTISETAKLNKESYLETFGKLANFTKYLNSTYQKGE